MTMRSLIIVAALVAMSGSCLANDMIVPMDPWPPWKIVNTDTWSVDSQGLDNQLIDVLLASYNQTFGANVKADYRGYPWKRCLAMMEMGSADFISGILKSAEREKYLIFLEPPYKTRSAKVFYVRKGEQLRIQRYEDLYTVKVGVQAGVRYFEPFDEDPEIQKEEAGDDLSNLRKLQYGRLDAVISTESQADYLIATQSLEHEFEKALYRYDYDLPVYFAISRRSPFAQYSAQFSRIISELSERGVFADVISNYMRTLRRQ